MKYILVTGAFGGMGQSAVDLYVKNGFTVFALDKKIGKAKDGVIPIETDITDILSVKNAFETVKSYTDNIFISMY